MTRSTLIFCLAFLGIGRPGNETTQGQNDLEIWKEFVSILKKGEFPKEKVRPYDASLGEALLGFLRQMRETATWEEWEAPEEIHRVGNQVHFLIPLSFDSQKGTYCFSFLVEEENWYFQHMESITIRLDRISTLPTSEFSDVSDRQKAWAREEIYWSEQVRLFNFLSAVKCKELAYEWVKDGIGNGAGYFLGARAWVPFVEPGKAFILYLCWEQSNLRGNKVTLLRLDDDEATVSMKPIYFELYKAAGHLKQQVSFEDYKKIFEAIWRERAANAGWEVTIEYQDEEVVFNLNKTGRGGSKA
ncbi:MAG TPA: hypothetical protein HPP83_00540 [Candidatus Hydrogenedentes bacterium]|nr:hypothetical protein [Candidatus Hydrogenedentota bacterium]